MGLGAAVVAGAADVSGADDAAVVGDDELLEQAVTTSIAAPSNAPVVRAPVLRRLAIGM
jgi:hypothetical protein